MRNSFAFHAALTVIVCCLGNAPAFAQQGPGQQGPGMGSTSPLGTSTSPLGTMSDPSTSSMSASASGIPLGATELNTPGISPMQSACPSASSNAAFDGGGSTFGAACSPDMASSSSNSSSVANSGATTMGLGGSALGSGIPLGATGLGTPGESQSIAVPTVPVSPCTSMPSAEDLSNSTGLVPANGC